MPAAARSFPSRVLGITPAVLSRGPPWGRSPEAGERCPHLW